MNAPQIKAQRFIGQRVPRKEDARLLTGKGTFVDDVVLPGMLHAAFVRSPIARGRIRSIGESPYVFCERKEGASKATAAVYVQYLKHLLRLRLTLFRCYLTGRRG